VSECEGALTFGFQVSGYFLKAYTTSPNAATPNNMVLVLSPGPAKFALTFKPGPGCAGYRPRNPGGHYPAGGLDILSGFWR